MDLSSPDDAPPYAGLRVVEIAGDIAGEMCGKLLAEMGADVVKVEPPLGSPTRRIGPFTGGIDDGEHSLTFWFYNLDKKSIVIDDSTIRGKEELHGLLRAADVLIVTAPPEEFERLALSTEGRLDGNPRLIVLSITPFGLDGPWAQFKSSDLVGLAVGGPLHACGYDDHSIPPIRPGGNQGFHTAASFAHLGLLLALIERQKSGEGQLIDVSMHESLAVTVELANPYWFYSKSLVHRQTARHAQPTATQSAMFETADGDYVYLLFVLSEQKAWEQLVAWLDSKSLAVDLTETAYADFDYRQAHYAHIQDLLECFFLLEDAETLYREGQQRGLPIGVMNAPDDLLVDPHLRARGFFVAVADDDGNRVEYPGPPYRFSEFGPAPYRRAPRLGEHTDELADFVVEAGSAGSLMAESHDGW